MAAVVLIFPVLFSLCGAAIQPVEKSYTASVGDNVQLTWNYDDENQRFSVDWTFQSENANTPESIMTQSSGNPASAENNYDVEHGGNGIITLKSVTMDSSGKYFCAVSYNLGSGLSPVTGTATLAVNTPTTGYKCPGLGNAPAVENEVRCICVWVVISSFCADIVIGFLIGVVLGCILKPSVYHWGFKHYHHRVCCRLKMKAVLQFDISAFLRPNNRITYNIQLNDEAPVALVRYEYGVVTTQQAEPGYIVTADANGKVELTIQIVEEDKEGIYSISGGGGSKQYDCLYIQDQCCCEDCVNNYYCACRCCASTPCGACCNIIGLPYWYQVLWASVLGIPVAFGIWVVLKCCYNANEPRGNDSTNNSSGDVPLNTKYGKGSHSRGRPQPPPPSGANSNHREGSGSVVSGRDVEMQETETSFKRRQLPDIHDKKGRGLSANYNDDDHPLVSINIPTKKPGALESIPDSDRQEVTKKKKKRKKRVETEDNQSD